MQNEVEHLITQKYLRIVKLRGWNKMKVLLFNGNSHKNSGTVLMAALRKVEKALQKNDVELVWFIS